MSNSEQPQEPDKALYQRDKTAKEPKVEAEAEIKPRPKPKIRKAFVPKKLVKKTDKPQEYRARHIRVSTLESANIFRQALVEFQKELASEPIDDPDKPFHDQEKLENYFIRIAKKYSTCSTKALGGDLDWVYKGMHTQLAATFGVLEMKKREETVTSELIDAITQSEKYVIPEPIKTKLGYHIILSCENRDRVEKEKIMASPKPKAAPAGTNIPT
ncbi:MAG: peptidylprolyl isomerase [Nitrospinales bacterium]|nr:peptidylprolyl isomerase [Nitrospinales bacterium]